MKSLILGEGHSTLENTRAQTAVNVKEDNIKKIPGKKYKSVVKVIETSSSLRDELSASMKLSANIHNVAPQVQGGFTQEIKFNVFDTFYLLRFSIEEYTELLQGKYGVDKEALEMLNKNPEAFRNIYGDSYIDSITYGRELTAIIQLKDTKSSKIRKENVDVKVKVPTFAEAAASFNHALDKLETSQVANIFYFTSGSKNPKLELLNNIQDLRDLVSKLKNSDVNGANDKDTTAKEKDESNNNETIPAKSDNKPSADNDADKAANNKGGKADTNGKATTANPKNKENKPTTKDKSKNGKKQNDNAKPALDSGSKDKKSTETDKSKEKTISKAQSPASTTSSTTKSDGNKSSNEDIEQDLVQVDYTARAYLKLISDVGSQRLQDKIHASDTLLRKMSECHDRISIYLNSIKYAFDNATSLAFNDANAAELRAAEAKLTSEDDRIKELSAIITENPMMDDKISSQYLAIINRTIRLINTLDTKLVKFSESAFLLKEVTSYYNKTFEDAQHSHRASHYFDLEIPSQTNSLIFRSSDADGAHEFRVKRRRPLIGKKIYGHVHSGIHQNDFAGRKRSDFHSLYIADPKTSKAKSDNDKFLAKIYAKTAHNFAPISEIEYFKLLTEESKKKYSEQVATDSQVYRSLRKLPYSASFNGTKLAFNSVSNSGVDANGDSNSCLAISLGITRRELYTTLLSNLDNTNVRNSLGEEIKSQLMSTGDQPLHLSDATMQKLVELYKNASEEAEKRNAIIEKYSKGMKEQGIDDLIKHYTDSSDLNKETILKELRQVQADLTRCDAELQAFITRRDVLKEFLDKNVLPSSITLSVNTAYAYGYAKNINIRVWVSKLDNNQQIELRDLGFQYIKDRPCMDILQLPGHFERLSLTVPNTRSVMMFSAAPTNNNKAGDRHQLVKSTSDDKLQMMKGG